MNEQLLDRFRSANAKLARNDAFPEAEALSFNRARIVSQGVDGRISLQLVNRDGDKPDSLPVHYWCGVPGVSAKVAPGQEVVLGFSRADLSDPVAFLAAPKGQPGHVPLEVRHEATTEIRFFSESAGILRIGPALPTPPAPLAIAPKVTELAAQISAALTALQTFALAVDTYADLLANATPTPPLPASAPMAATLHTARTTLDGALVTLYGTISGLAAPYPAGYTATRTESL